MSLVVSDDALNEIASYLQVADLLITSIVSSRWRVVSDGNRAWQLRLNRALKLIHVEPVIREDEADVYQYHNDQSLSSTSSASLADPPDIETVADALSNFRLRSEQANERSPPLCVQYVGRALTAPPSIHTAEFQYMVLMRVDRLQHTQKFESAIFKYEGNGWKLQRLRPLKPHQIVLLNAEPNVGLFKPRDDTSPARSSKEQYLHRFRCSAHNITGCKRLLVPAVPLLPQPSPRVLNSMFLEGLHRGLPFEELQDLQAPPSIFPALSPLPLCRSCAQIIAADIQPSIDDMCEKSCIPRKQISCIVRVNRVMFDVRFQNYETDAEYRRFVVTHPATHPTLGHTEGHAAGWKVESKFEPESGVYAIGVPSNVVYQNPAPPSAHMQPRKMRWHKHELEHYALAPYHRHSFICNVCQNSFVREPLWHCSACQFDCCLSCIDMQQ